MKIIKEIFWGVIISVIIMIVGVSADVSVLEVIGGFGLGFFLGKLSNFIEMEKKYG